MRAYSALLVFAAVACSASVPPSSPAPSPTAERTSVAATLTPPEEAPWAELVARPLRLPAIAPGASCPISPTRPIPGTAAGAGDGPIYPVGSSPLVLAGGSQKVLWTSAPEYKDVGLIRGRRLDGTDVIRFSGGASELRFPVRTGVSSEYSALGWRDLPSTVLLGSPGCYGYQIDGIGFTTIVVFEAK